MIDNIQHLQCIFRANFITQRERWWFLVVANCDSKTGLDLMYNVTLLNNKTQWLQHYSADEYAVYPINLITLIIYCLLLICIIIESVKLIERKFFHLTFRIFILSIIFEFLGLIFVFQFNYNYSYYGYANSKYKTLGKGFTVLSNLLFLLLLILIAKGYSVTRARLKSRTSVRIAIFMTLYALCFFFLYFYEQCCFDKAEVLYVYESWIGVCLIILRFVGLFWFTVSLFRTLKLYPSKKPFFYVVYVVYFVWFVSTPAIILLATFVIPKYQREQIVYGFENIVIVRAHLFFLVITWPAKSNKFFPFHVRTSQIDAMEKVYLNKNKNDKTVSTIENSGEKLDKFTSYQYAPSSNDDNTDLLFKLNNNNVLFNKQNHHSNGFNGTFNNGFNGQSNGSNNLNLGDSNYKNIAEMRKKSLPDIS